MSSYANMDHAGWVQAQISGNRCQKTTKRERDAAAEHKGWLAAPVELNAFQVRAFNILGIVGGCIYNCPIGWDSLIWNRRFIIAPWFDSLATWDFQQLTRLVLLCHDARIRGSIEPCNNRYLQISLHERVAAGNIAVRHPSLAEAIAAHRGEISESHSICYRENPDCATVEAAE